MPCPSYNLRRSLLILKYHLPIRGSVAISAVQTWLSPFQKHIRYGLVHFQQRSGPVLFRSKNCFESSISGVNRSAIWYTFCNALFHCPAHCEHHLSRMPQRSYRIWPLLYSPSQRFQWRKNEGENRSAGRSKFSWPCGPLHPITRSWLGAYKPSTKESTPIELGHKVVPEDSNAIRQVNSRISLTYFPGFH